MIADVLPQLKGSFLFDQTRLNGLRLKMSLESNTVCCELNLGHQLDGETGSISNGMTFGIMEIMMWYAILANTGRICVTRKVTVDFLKPLEADKAYTATGKFLGMNGKDVRVSANIKNESEEICAEVDAVFFENRDLTLEGFLKHPDFTSTPDEVKKLIRSLIDKKNCEEEQIEKRGEFYPYGPV